MLRPTVSRPVYLGDKPHLGPKTRFLLLSDSCGFEDMGRALCNRDHVLLTQIRDFPILEGQVPIFISPRNMVSQLYPQALRSLLSPPMTRKATVEVFEPASTRGLKTEFLLNNINV
jgi:hypothetical protein